MHLGRDAVPGWLVGLSLPRLVALLVTKLYNTVDTVFVGHAVGRRAVTGRTSPLRRRR